MKKARVELEKETHCSDKNTSLQMHESLLENELASLHLKENLTGNTAVSLAEAFGIVSKPYATSTDELNIFWEIIVEEALDRFGQGINAEDILDKLKSWSLSGDKSQKTDVIPTRSSKTW